MQEVKAKELITKDMAEGKSKDLVESAMTFLQKTRSGRLERPRLSKKL